MAQLLVVGFGQLVRRVADVDLEDGGARVLVGQRDVDPLLKPATEQRAATRDRGPVALPFRFREWSSQSSPVRLADKLCRFESFLKPN